MWKLNAKPFITRSQEKLLADWTVVKLKISKPNFIERDLLHQRQVPKPLIYQAYSHKRVMTIPEWFRLSHDKDTVQSQTCLVTVTGETILWTQMRINLRPSACSYTTKLCQLIFRIKEQVAFSMVKMSNQIDEFCQVLIDVLLNHTWLY